MEDWNMLITRFMRASFPAWLALGIFATPLLGWAQTAWPQRPIRVVIPFPPGGPTDIVMRAAADGMQTVLRQPVVIDNKPGAGGNIGAGEVARAAADGYTWLFSTDTVMTVNPHVYKSLGFKVEDLRPAMIVTQFSQTLVCSCY
jgi:tripartite-type tricarboxylate transporter receptor subunit TctC